MPSHSPHASRPSTFRAPGWGALALPSSCCWRSTTSQRLAPFSRRSALRIFIRHPGCIPSPMVTQDGDHQFDGGEKQVGLRPLPRPQLQGSSSSLLGRRAGRAGVLPPTGAGDPLLPTVIGGEGRSPALRRGRTSTTRGRSAASVVSSSMPGPLAQLALTLLPVPPPTAGVERGCSPIVRAAVAPCAPGDRPRRRTPLGRRSCSWIVLSLLRHDASARRSMSAHPRGLEWGSAGAGWGAICERISDSLALTARPRPSCGVVGEGLLTTAFALRSSLSLSCRPRRRSLPRCCSSGRRRATRSLSSRRSSDVEVVHTRGSGTGVPFVMAP
jgi:hypothetical protein